MMSRQDQSRSTHALALSLATVMAGFWILAGYGIKGPDVPVPPKILYGGAGVIFIALFVTIEVQGLGRSKTGGPQ